MSDDTQVDIWVEDNSHSTKAQNDTHSDLAAKGHLQAPGDDDGDRQYHQIREEIERSGRDVECTLIDTFTAWDGLIVDVSHWVALEDINQDHGEE
jgi:hypothetical protein